MRALFEKYGPIAEVHLPIDKTTKRITGIGFVTFVMPEHAVVAFNEIDGKVFQGRLLHVITARGKRATESLATGQGKIFFYSKTKQECFRCNGVCYGEKVLAANESFS